MPRKSKKPFRDGKVHVLTKQCATCVFHSGNKMSLGEGALEALVSSNLKVDSAFACHETLDDKQAICRGFFNRYQKDVTPLRLAIAFQVIEFQPPPKMEK